MPTMPTILANNWICATPGQPALVISTNITDCFELGRQQGTDYWLEAKVVDGEFLFNGRLFLSQAERSAGTRSAGTIIDNFPKGPAPAGWTRHPHVDEEGYDLKSDVTLFGYRVVPWQIPGTHIQSRLCLVTVNIYAADGGVVAESLPDQFLLHRSPANIGTQGISLG
jgi:hypothetical protein